jgi:hypothetical protein
MKSIKLIAILTLFATYATAQTNKTMAEMKAQSDSLLGSWEVVKIENLKSEKTQEFVSGNNADFVIISARAGGYNVLYKPYRGNLLRAELNGYSAQQILRDFTKFKQSELESIAENTFTIITIYNSEKCRVTFQKTVP